MKIGETLGNNVMVKLDPSNDMVETESGFKLYIDTSYEPEKHIVRLGTVIKAPKRLYNRDFMGEVPWVTHPQIQDGDRVIMYFLAVQNCLSKEQKKFIREGDDFYIFIRYHNIYAVIRDDKIIPINGYVLVEPVEDPAKVRRKELAAKLDLILPEPKELSKTDCTYGKIAYIGEPNARYNHPQRSDEHYNLNVGDTIIMKRIRDIPLEYELHAKLDGGRKMYRMQRHDILAKV